jgi:ferredoxin
MYKRYHIPITTVAGRAQPVPKFVITRADNCMNCGKCEKACIFGAHKRSEEDPRKMADPLSQLCKNCFRCISDCPQRALTMSPGAEYKALGRGVWTPLRISTVWGEAETGKIPVLGAGYRGMFAGPHYDGMWTDMSEIVRPTRDGIHGREFISTSVDIGSKALFLEFNTSGALKTKVPKLLELPIPMVFDVTRLRSTSDAFVRGCARAARHLDTLMFAQPSLLSPGLHEEFSDVLVTSFPERTPVEGIDPPKGTRMIELATTESWEYDVEEFNKRFPDLILSMRMKSSSGVEDRILKMLQAGVPVVHVEYDEQGMEQGEGELRHARESLRAIHKRMVAKAQRDRITVIAGGGIAAAEHVPKTLICGADVAALEKALAVALECRDCLTCSKGSCPINLQDASADWVEGRITNLVGAWRDQMLEVLGAMGLREVRRLRGELGRAIFFDDVENELLANLGGGEKRA